jgi:hypothetical protein
MPLAAFLNGMLCFEKTAGNAEVDCLEIQISILWNSTCRHCVR